MLMFCVKYNNDIRNYGTNISKFLLNNMFMLTSTLMAWLKFPTFLVVCLSAN